MFCLSQVEILQYKHLQDFVEIVNSGFVKVFFCVLHGMPYCRKRGWNQMQDWNPYKKESEIWRRNIGEVLLSQLTLHYLATESGN